MPALGVSMHMGKGEHILIIDDAQQQRVLASKMLERLGYKVSSVIGGNEAVDFLKENKVDLILLDMIMSPIDGLDTYKEVLKLHPMQKAVVVSGYSETERLKEVLTLGAGAFLQKPYNMVKFAEVIRAEIDKQKI